MLTTRPPVQLPGAGHTLEREGAQAAGPQRSGCTSRYTWRGRELSAPAARGCIVYTYLVSFRLGVHNNPFCVIFYLRDKCRPLDFFICLPPKIIEKHRVAANATSWPT